MTDAAGGAPPSASRPALLVSLHDVSPLTRADCEGALALLAHAGLPRAALTVLVIPRHEGAVALDEDAATTRLLRTLADEGATLVMHGLTHRMPGRAWTPAGFVRFAGLQAGDTLKKLYASARVFAFASRVDTLGLVNMEAMASGLPVLVPADACIAEFVTHGSSAECYPFGAAGLASALANVLDDPSRAARLAEGGRQAMIARWNEASFSRIWKSLTQST